MRLRLPLARAAAAHLWQLQIQDPAQEPKHCFSVWLRPYWATAKTQVRYACRRQLMAARKRFGAWLQLTFGLPLWRPPIRRIEEAYPPSTAPVSQSNEYIRPGPPEGRRQAACAPSAVRLANEPRRH